MRDLQSLQDLMTAAIFKGEASDIEAELVAGQADAAGRFGIYRNNTFLSLTAHLKAVFPATAQLGDERFFAYAAHQFIHRHPPRESRLAAYGGSFARFLSTFPASRFSPILARMAALEWAVHCALTSAEKPPLAPAAMAALETASGQARLELQPSLRFTVSRWPLLGLWARQSARDKPLPRRPTRIAALRHGDDIRLFELGPARFAFWRALAGHASLEAAAARAFARDPSFDLAGEILTLFRTGLVTGITPVTSLH